MEELTNKKIVSSISWSLAEKILTDVVSTLITLVLARLLLPSDYGTVGLVQIFINISLIFVNTGLSTSLIQKKNANEEQVSTAFYINIILGIFIYVVLFFLSPLIARIKGNEMLCPMFRVLALKIPISSIYSMQHAYVKKILDFKTYFFSSLAGTIAAGIIGIYLAFKGYGAWALVVSTLVDQIMDSIILFFSTKWFPKYKISLSKSKDIISFGIKTLTREFIIRTYNELRSLIIGFRYKDEDLAFSKKGQKLPELISEITESTMIRVMFPVFSFVQDDKNKLKEMVSNTVKLSSFFITPLLVGLAVTADVSVPLILTENWLPCIPYLRICCINRILAPITHADFKAIEANGKGNELLLIQITGIIVGTITIFLAVFLLNDPLYIIASTLIETIVTTILLIIYSNKFIKYTYFEHLNDVKSPFIISAIMGLVVFFIGKLQINKLLLLIIQVVTGACIYFGLSFLFRIKALMLVFEYIKNRNKTNNHNLKK